MPSIRARVDNNLLFFEFRYLGLRCREQTLLEDNLTNRKKLEKVLARIESEIDAGTFVYADYFPTSKALPKVAAALAAAKAKTEAFKDGVIDKTTVAHAVAEVTQNLGPVFREFANTWFEQRCIQWRRSHIRALQSTLNGRLIPYFGDKVVGSITKSDVLQFRTELGKVKGRGTKDGLSAKRINEIMGLLRQILDEATDQYEFKHPMSTIKKLKQQKVDVNPFSLQDVQRILATVRPDYRNYMVIRFFTGMRTGEVHGLKWKYVDFDLRIIRVRETFVLGEDEYTKTDGSQRDIQMSAPVMESLRSQWEATGKLSEYVFCNVEGKPLDNKNFSDRVWYPLLRHLGLERRRPYQTRHTAATLWLASGEAPEWIARQLGHTDTQMLFKVYSRYVPNLTRQDGSAMERLLAAKLSHGPLAKVSDAAGEVMAPVDPIHSDVLRQAIPRPGNWKKAAVQWTPQEAAQSKTQPSSKSVEDFEHARVDSATEADEIGKVFTPSQAQPVSWEDMARNWLEAEFQPPSATHLRNPFAAPMNGA